MRRLAIGLAIVAGLALAAWLGALAALDWYGRASQDPAFFEDEIAAFEAADRVQAPPGEPIVFVGSSSIRLWKTLAADMAPLPVLNRGFGGSQLTHVIHFADRTVIHYRPRAVVLYAGDNDLDARTGKTADDVVSAFLTFRELVHSQLPKTRIYYISIKPSRMRWERWPEQEKANAAIAALAAEDQRSVYLDVATPMLATGQPPSRDLFRFDGLHLSARGYALWTSVVRPRLLADFPELAR